MGFGLNLNITGDFLPIVKIDARTGRIFAWTVTTAASRRLSTSPTVFEVVFDLGPARSAGRTSRRAKRLISSWSRLESRCRSGRRRTTVRGCACA